MGSGKRAALDLAKIPEDCSLENIHQLYVRQKLQRSLEAAGAGRTKTHDEVKKRLAKWLAR